MTLNENCMKDIMQHCVNNIHISSFGVVYTSIKVFDLPKLLSKQYTPDDVYYSALKLIELKYITISTIDIKWSENTFVNDVTYAGHKYLESFNQNKNSLTGQ